eukprot:CAMPEP_0197664684 /NCGR_PEP_ID=MMETSP1338-20131121/58789_1 /TAXON_ID=43686 ORGANISM="Pelagodinium beii, Strain RCC1491" /NCGR_SAMPLE_ID=MMETSP1338 /ASSEMBLY_ACC=CAM_ASM_000754 /LENGTH=200 /DNA_ID=CAMNT_0043243379 /DNA_START=182 /DNA_END=784 /DNA_ORIENTATION=-
MSAAVRAVTEPQDVLQHQLIKQASFLIDVGKVPTPTSTTVLAIHPPRIVQASVPHNLLLLAELIQAPKLELRATRRSFDLILLLLCSLMSLEGKDMIRNVLFSIKCLSSLLLRLTSPSCLNPPIATAAGSSTSPPSIKASEDDILGCSFPCRFNWPQVVADICTVGLCSSSTHVLRNIPLREVCDGIVQLPRTGNAVREA